jgi:3-oxoacyl-[acyl-carrier-protein] synthase-1
VSRIYITGTGIVSAIGNNVEATLQSLLAGKSGISDIKYLKTAHTEFPVGEVKMSNEQMMLFLQIPENQITTRTSLMGMLAVKEALKNAKIDIQTRTNLKICFINGTTVGGMDKSEQFYRDFLENNKHNSYIKSHDCGTCTEMIADYFGIFNQVQTISTACSSAANAIMLGALLLESGRADIVVAGGTESITKFHLNGFNTLMILDKDKCRPFDARRAGLNLGEGAAYLVMERADSTHNQPLAVLAGYANACDAYHQTSSSPDGQGAYIAMKKALETASMQPTDIDYINAHGTGTFNNDLSEGTAIERLFCEEIPPVSSTKAVTGHATSAAGSCEAVISILALQHNFIPENLNFKEKMPELRFSPYSILSRGNEKNSLLNNILSNSFGFGGNDTSLIFKKTC